MADFAGYLTEFAENEEQGLATYNPQPFCLMMSYLKRSFVLLFWVCTNQLHAEVGPDLVQGPRPDHVNASMVNQPMSEQFMSIQALELAMLLITCFTLIYVFYRLNKDRQQMMKRIEQISQALEETNGTPMALNHSNVRIEEAPAESAEEKKLVTMKTRDAKWLESLDEVLQSELSNSLLKPMDIAAQMGVCERQLQRKLKKLTGTSPAQYLNQVRLKKGYQYLKSGDFQTISEVAYKVGYKYPDYFSKSFKKFFGIKPNELLNSVIML